MQAMPTGNLHCFDCGADLAVRRPTAAPSSSSSTRRRTQAAAFEFYRLEVARLAAAGWYPVAHSWGDEPAGQARVGDRAPPVRPGR